MKAGLLFAVLILGGVSVCAVSDAGEAAGRREFAAAAAAEDLAAVRFPLTNWEPERLRELARSIGAMPDDIAAKALWLVACAPPQVDTISVFASALESNSPLIRRVALSILVGDRSSDSRRLLLNTVSMEKSEDIIAYIVEGLATLPKNWAVRGLMDVMFLPGIRGPAVKQAAAELRRLTRTEISDSPGDWRDWWLDNEDLYD